MTSCSFSSQPTTCRFSLLYFLLVLDIYVFFVGEKWNLAYSQHPCHLTTLQVMDSESIALGTDSVAITLNKLRHELEHLSEPSNPASVGSFLERKRVFLFRKFILALHNFMDTMLAKGHFQGVQLVQSLVQSLVAEVPSYREVQFCGIPFLQV